MPQRKLVVGIGGTGTKIVHQMAEHWQRFGQGTPSNVALVSLDAKKKPESPDLNRDVRFTGVPEPINFGPDHAEHMGKPESGVRSWWIPEMSPAFNISFTDGCGCHRIFGRYFAFRYAGHIADVLQRTIDDLFRQEVRTHADAPAVEVWLTGSLANGTGGGTFLEVATILADLINRKVGSRQRPVIQGLFLPGSVTRHGPNPDQIRRQISAAGIGSLVELQAEFNRLAVGTVQDDSLVPRMEGQRVFRGFLNGQYRDFSTPVDANGVGQPPIDAAYLLERQNRGGWVTDYPRLLQVAADALAGLLDGADQEDRGLDVLSRVATHTRRFGSLGYCRMRAPVQEIGTYVTADSADQALQFSSGTTDPDAWQELLSLRGIGLPAALVPRAGESGRIEVRDSVTFFIGEVLRIRERCDNRGSWAEVNDLFDRLDVLDQDARRSFANLLDRAAEEDNLQAMTSVVEEAFSQLQRTEQEVTGRYRQTMEGLLYGRDIAPDTLARAAAEGDIDTIRGLGVNRLLQQVCRRFLQEGAFAMLATWLEEFVRQIELHHSSVVEGERSQWQVRDDVRPLSRLAALQERSAELRSRASGIMQRLFKMGGDKLKSERDGLLSEASSLHASMLRHGKVVAVEAFYRDVEALPGPALTLAQQAAAALNACGARDGWRREMGLIAQRLDARNENFRTELVVGSSETAAHIARALAADPEAGRQTILRAAGSAESGAIAPELVAFLRGLQPNAAAALFPDPEGDEPSTAGVDAWAEHVQSTTRRIVFSRMGRFANLTSLVRDEAAAAFRAWQPYWHVMESSGQDVARAEFPDFRLIESNFDEVFGRDGTVTLKNAVRAGTAEAWAPTALTRLALRERLRQVIHSSTPQWLPARDIEGRAILSLSAASEGDLLHIVAREFCDEKPDTRSLSLVPGMSRDIVECVHVEIGASIADLDLAGEMTNYEEGLAWETHTGQGFSPHVSAQYEDVGRQWLQRRRLSAAGRAPRGAGLLALALYRGADGLFGWLAADGENIAWTRTTPVLTTSAGDLRAGGRVFNDGTPLTDEGLAAAISALDSHDADDHAAARQILAELLWTDLQCWVNGDNERASTPIADIVQALASEAARLGQEAAAATRRDVGQALSGMRDQVQRLAAELQATGGQERPSILREG